MASYAGEQMNVYVAKFGRAIAQHRVMNDLSTYKGPRRLTDEWTVREDWACHQPRSNNLSSLA